MYHSLFLGEDAKRVDKLELELNYTLFINYFITIMYLQPRSYV